MRRTTRRLLRFVSRISIRLLAFNVLLVFVPVFGFLFLASYERTLLDAQERAMVQVGRILAAALSERGAVDTAEAERILVNLRQQQEFRLRVLDADGSVIADSSRLGPRREGDDGGDGALTAPPARRSLPYRIGLFLYRPLELLSPPPPPSEAGAGPIEALSERAVASALAGRYGSDTRVSPGIRSMTLYSALPIRDGGAVIGAVVVSRSTYRILQALYDLRISAVQVVLASILAAAVISLLLSTTIARPLRRLQRDARALLDRRGRLRRRFLVLDRQDEIGDLSRALAELTHRLEDHQRFLESFASDVSHEFKNPLAAIRNATELLEEVDDPAEHARFTAMILGDVARLEQLLSEVREVTQIDAEIEHESVEPVALMPLLRALIEQREMRRRPAHEPGVRYRLHHAGDGDGGDGGGDDAGAGIAVLATPARLYRVFENLLDNAAGFSPPGSEVEITVAKRAAANGDVPGEIVVVAVRDRGPGIVEGHLDKIFGRFFTYRPGGARGEHGHTGLGLAIVKAIVEGYGGRVHARNAGDGGDGGGDGEGGAVLTVALPAA